MKGHAAAIGRSRLAVLVCAATLMLRVLVPAGWMPGMAADGMIRIELCSGAGTVTAWMDRDGRVHGEKPGGTASGMDQPCAFSGLALPFTGGEPGVTLRVPPLPSQPLLLPALALAVGRGLAAPPPPPTGPPSHL